MNDTKEIKTTVAVWGQMTPVADLPDQGPNPLIGRSAEEALTEQKIIETRSELARQASGASASEMVRCSCGHTVARIDVMSTSTGTSCPDCYDRMS